MIGDIFTLYELRCGEDQEGAPFYEMDEATFRRAVKVLQDDGRATLFQQGGEEGIKFFDLAWVYKLQKDRFYYVKINDINTFAPFEAFKIRTQLKTHFKRSRREKDNVAKISIFRKELKMKIFRRGSGKA